MLQEALEVFEKKYKKDERIVIDAHSLKDGTYRLIEMNDDGWKIRKTLDIIYDKKNKETVGYLDDDYTLIRQLDYYSKLLEMNKPIDFKKVIHSNNYFSISVKKENIVSKKLTDDIIKNYYNVLKNPISKYEKKAKSRKLYEKVEEELGKVDIDLINKIENYVLTHDIFENIDLSKKNYAKVFFIFSNLEETIEYYRKESQRYLLPNLYNSNDYNFDDNGEILGLSNNNMGMNSKKPYLENKTRKIKVPYLLNQQQALLQSRFFDYLWGRVSKGQYDFYIITDKGKEDIKSLDDVDEFANGYYLRCHKEKNEVKIIQADNVIDYSKKLKKPFIVKNYIGLSDEMICNSKLDYDVYMDELWQICELINIYFFERKLKSNFYSEIGDIQINDPLIKRLVMEYRDILSAWFYRDKTVGLESAIDKFTSEIILNSLRKNNLFKARLQLNLRWSLLAYFNEERKIGGEMMEIKNKLSQHINLPISEDWDFDNDKEFAYAIGQAINYFVYLNKSSNKTQSYVNRYLNEKDIDVLKSKIETAYKKYNYIIPYNPHSRESKLISHIMMYEPKKINTEYIIGGFTAPLLIFEKKKEEKENE